MNSIVPHEKAPYHQVSVSFVHVILSGLPSSGTKVGPRLGSAPGIRALARPPPYRGGQALSRSPILAAWLLYHFAWRAVNYY